MESKKLKIKSFNCKKSDKLFIFDLDRTLISVNSSFCFGKYLFQKKVLSLSRVIRLVFLYTLHKFGFLSIKQLHEETFKCFFLDLSVEMIEKNADLFLAEKFDSLIYRPVFEHLKKAKASNGYTAILSSSPDFLVEKIAHLLKVDLWEATVYHKTADLKYSHISQFIEGKEKSWILQQWQNELNIPKENVTVFSDSYLDLPLLLMAGHPFAVNPDRYLRKHCDRFKWPVI